MRRPYPVPVIHLETVLENIFRDIAGAEVYIDDRGVFSDSWEQHKATLRVVLQKLQKMDSL